MSIGLAFFAGILLSGSVVVAFLLEYFNNRKFAKMRKNTNLKRQKCEVCAEVYFVSILSEFWRCPRCDSINKEK
ncbi:MAG: hypothetical protein K9L86_07850 [Candidatus Omnitrophica bacterium]|nr:hypothetical protein [Candidatus Omnitrophota bacterium]